MKRKGWLVFGGVLTIALATQIQSCAKKDESSSSGPQTYSSTGSTGDYAEWTVSGSSLSAVWKVTTSSGAVEKTFTVAADCATADATFGYKTCTVTSGSCTDGTGTCSPGDAPSAGSLFDTFEVPGVAIMVKGRGAGEQLHVGFLKDTSCASVAGDYTYMMTGVGKRDLFGVYRTDSTFTSITHADFGMSYSGSEGNTPTVSYTTQGGTGTGAETLTGTGCSDGVRERIAGSDTIRMAATSAGAFIVDLPSGQGGLVAFKTTTAATLADFASKNFGGIAFPDQGNEWLLAASTGAVSGDKVSITNLVKQQHAGSPNNESGASFKAVTTTTWEATSPAHPNFTATPGGTYSNNALQSTYSTASAIPGLFVIDGPGFTSSDKGRVFLVAMKSSGKVVAFGSVYNYRDHDSNSGTPTILVNTGAFILFEK